MSATAGDLVWACEGCGEPIADGEGWVTIAFAEIAAHRAAEAEWRRQHPPGQLINLADDVGPPPVAWHVWHRDCDPDIDSHDYWFRIERVRTAGGLLTMTAHLMEKCWLAGTTWGHALRLQGNQLDALETRSQVR